MPDEAYEGSCYCGGVTIRVSGAPVAAGYCHCRSCRKWHGTLVNGWALWPTDRVTVSAGAELLHEFDRQGGGGPSGRGTCGRCGGALLNRKPQVNMTVVYAMTLAESEFAFEPTMHLHYGEAVLDMSDGLPKFVDLPKPFGGSGELVGEPSQTKLR